jgi:hypothetical protein
MMSYPPGGPGPFEPPPPIDTEQALRILDRVHEIARDEHLTLGASFGTCYGPGGPGQITITFTPKQNN